MAGALNKQGRLLYFYGLGGGSGDGARGFLWASTWGHVVPSWKKTLFSQLSWDIFQRKFQRGIALASNNNNHDEYKFEVRKMSNSRHHKQWTWSTSSTSCCVNVFYHPQRQPHFNQYVFSQSSFFMQKDATRVSLLHTFKHLFLKTNLLIICFWLKRLSFFWRKRLQNAFFFLGGGYEGEAIKPKAKMDPTYKPHILNI